MLRLKTSSAASSTDEPATTASQPASATGDTGSDSGHTCACPHDHTPTKTPRVNKLAFPTFGNLDKGSRRRWAVIGIGAAVVMFALSNLTVGAPDTETASVSVFGADEVTADQDTGTSAKDDVGAALAAAQRYRDTQATFAGFTYPDVLVASSADTVLIASAGSDNVCWFTGIVANGQPNEVTLDPEGAACSPLVFDEARKVLADTVEAAAGNDIDVITDRLALATEAANVWSQTTFNPTNGRPSLLGLDEHLDLPNVTTLEVEASGDWMHLEVTSGDVCRQAVVYAGSGRPTEMFGC